MCLCKVRILMTMMNMKTMMTMMLMVTMEKKVRVCLQTELPHLPWEQLLIRVCLHFNFGKISTTVCFFVFDTTPSL